jgi:uncharacterized protein YutE (UPF0331/DUF86 family)
MEKEVIESKLDSLLELLKKLKDILAERKTNFKFKEYLLYAAEKKAEETVELAISINQELLRSRNKIGKSYYESFTNLEVFKKFSESELKELASTAGFRNRLAHEYLDVNEGLALMSMEKILKIYPKYVDKVRQLVK